MQFSRILESLWVRVGRILGPMQSTQQVPYPVSGRGRSDVQAGPGQGNSRDREP